MRNSLARKVTADAPNGVPADAASVPVAVVTAEHSGAASPHSPVRALQERLWEEFDPSRERIVLASFSNKQAVAPASFQHVRRTALILSAGIGGWALFFAGSVLGLY